MRNLFLTLFLTGFFLLTSISVWGQTAEQPSLADMISTYRADYGALDRKYSVQPSEEYFGRFERLYADWLQRLDELEFDDLPHAQQVDYLLFKNDLERSAYFSEVDRDRFNNITQHLPAKDEIMRFAEWALLWTVKRLQDGLTSGMQKFKPKKLNWNQMDCSLREKQDICQRLS